MDGEKVCGSFVFVLGMFCLDVSRWLYLDDCELV